MDDFGLYHYVQGPVRSAATRVSAGARYRVGSAASSTQRLQKTRQSTTQFVRSRIFNRTPFIALAKGTKVVESDKYQIVA